MAPVNDLAVLGLCCSCEKATDAPPLDLYHVLAFDEWIDRNAHSLHGPLKLSLALTGGS